jgi:hypothetical protein
MKLAILLSLSSALLFIGTEATKAANREAKKQAKKDLKKDNRARAKTAEAANSKVKCRETDDYSESKAPATTASAPPKQAEAEPEPEIWPEFPFFSIDEHEVPEKYRDFASINEAALRDLFNQMGLLTEKADLDRPEVTWTQYTVKLLDDLSKIVDFSELDAFAMKDFEERKKAYEARHPSESAPAAAVSTQPAEPVIAASGNQAPTSSAPQETLQSSSQSPPINSTPTPNKNDNRNQKNNGNDKGAKKKGGNNNNKNRNPGQKKSSPPKASPNSTTPAPQSPKASAEKSAVPSAAPETPEKSTESPTRTSPKTIQKESVPEIKENYVPAFIKTPTADDKAAFARHLDPLLKGDLSKRETKNNHKQVIEQYARLIKAMGPTNPETIDFIRAEFTFDEKSDLKRFALERTVVWENMIKGFVDTLRGNMEGTPRSERARIGEVCDALSTLYQGPVRAFLGPDCKDLGFLFADCQKYLANTKPLLADLVMDLVPAEYVGTGGIRELAFPPSDVIQKINDEHLTGEGLLPPGIMSALNALSLGDYAFSLVMSIVDLCTKVLPADTRLIDFDDLRIQVDRHVDTVLISKLHEDSLVNITDMSFNKTMKAWLLGWLATAAVGHAHTDLPEFLGFDFGYYKQYLAALKDASGDLRKAMMRALRLKVIGDATEYSFISVNKLGQSTVRDQVLDSHKKAHSGDDALIDIFKAAS